MTLVRMLLGALVASGLLLVGRRTLETRRGGSRREERDAPTRLDLLIGLVTNFFDTLGIGSLATTTALYRLFRLVPDEIIPGTIIVGDALCVLTQAVLFIGVVSVDPLQMTALIVVCVAGGWIGAGVVASLSRRAVQLGMGGALLVAAAFMVLGMLGQFPAGGTALAFAPRAFAIALVVNFLLGAVLPLGIGNYAPSLVVFSVLGIDPRAAFPIMMGSGAFVATTAGIRFVAAGRFHRRAALGLTAGGIPGVIAAVYLVTSLPLEALRWIVLAVVAYASLTLLRAGLPRGAAGLER
ncbi:MAG TPA: sulfite exporter TauE/SafE family protein [Vicinamibacterales bacterium]|nr:sulfite exporter TauE/SafE family protein [Vicinamibacterales bacterium]